MQTISAILSVLTALLTHLCTQTTGIDLSGVCFVSQQIFPSQVMLLFYVVRGRVYSSLESGWKWHNSSNSSDKPSSACSFYYFWPSSGRSVFRTGQDFKLCVGANTSFIQKKNPETEHEVGWKHFSCINMAGGVEQETEVWRRRANTSYEEVMRNGWCACRFVRDFLQLRETQGRQPCTTEGNW